MRRFAIVWIIILIAGIYGWYIANTNDTIIQQSNKLLTPSPSFYPRSTSQEATVTHGLFVPYWSLPITQKIDSAYATLLYFGIAANHMGIETTDPGYTRLASLQTIEDRPTLLVLRMIESSENSKILADPQIQQHIIVDTIALAKQYHFQGVVLDLEMNALPFSTVVQQISDFNDHMQLAVKRQGLSYGITIYGDAVYRPRPFALKHLATIADMVYVLAYDLHKANGQPGPNFPIRDTNNDYDLAKMASDYLAIIPANKLTVVFGLYGYDWPIDSKGNSTDSATSLSYLAIKSSFLDHCSSSPCRVRHDGATGETTVQYTDAKKRMHILWFDDPDSVAAKEKFLQHYGITHFSYWAYSYF